MVRSSSTSSTRKNDSSSLHAKVTTISHYGDFRDCSFSSFILGLIVGWEQSRLCNNMMMNSTTFYMSISYREVIFTHVPNISV
jgi:hypothetical protein